MKFRSKTNQPVYVSSTTGVCAWVGPEWRELPECLHRAALMMDGGTAMSDQGIKYQKGHIISDGAHESDMPEAPMPEPGRNDALSARLEDVLVELATRGQESDFTRAGLPDLRKLTKKCGFSVEHDEMVRCWKLVKARLAA